MGKSIQELPFPGTNNVIRCFFAHILNPCSSFFAACFVKFSCHLPWGWPLSCAASRDVSHEVIKNDSFCCFACMADGEISKVEAKHIAVQVLCMCFNLQLDICMAKFWFSVSFHIRTMLHSYFVRCCDSLGKQMRQAELQQTNYPCFIRYGH